jgi:hypothetical protein
VKTGDIYGRLTAERDDIWISQRKVYECSKALAGAWNSFDEARYAPPSAMN